MNSHQGPTHKKVNNMLNIRAMQTPTHFLIINIFASPGGCHLWKRHNGGISDRHNKRKLSIKLNLYNSRLYIQFDKPVA